MSVATTAAPPIDKEALIREAVSLGYKPDEIARTPTYVIQSMIAERKKKKSKRQVHRTGDADVKVYAEQIVYAAPATLVDTAKDAVATAKGDDDQDDTKTVVNMDFITSTENPSDQKYSRFSCLVAMKGDLIRSIKTNTALLQTNLTKFDSDDVAVVQREIAKSQHHLGLVNTEIREINQWFSEVHQQKYAFYQQFLQNSANVTGEMTSHFQRKMENIQKYMRAMHEQSQLHADDLK